MRRSSEQLVEARQQHQLLGLDLPQSCGVQHLDQELADVAPVRLQPRLGIQLLAQQALLDRPRLVTERLVEHVCQ